MVLIYVLMWLVVLIVYGAFITVAIRLIPTFGTPGTEIRWPRWVRGWRYHGARAH